MPGPNNRRIADRLERQRRYLTNALADAEAAPLLAGRGYTADKIAEGLALNAAALNAYGGRDTASGALKASQKALAEADDHAHDLMEDLRATLRAVYDGQTEHLTTLGVVRKRDSGDRDTFITETRVTVDAVRQALYADAAAEAGQTKKDVDAVEAAIDALALAAGTEDSATGGRRDATGARDGAYDASQQWVDRFRRLARIAFKARPGIDARLTG
ncbi:MAG TPA: hypothetical protein VF594_10190 [Rubricoccaceae bacterium]|jgi:hypothetical protein